MHINFLNKNKWLVFMKKMYLIISKHWDQTAFDKILISINITIFLIFIRQVQCIFIKK
jgi:hypothetical protein